MWSPLRFSVASPATSPCLEEHGSHPHVWCQDLAMVSAPSTPPRAFLQGKAASSAPSLMPLPARVHILRVRVLNFHPADDPGPWHPPVNGWAHCEYNLPCIGTLLPRAPARQCRQLPGAPRRHFGAAIHSSLQANKPAMLTKHLLGNRWGGI